MHITVAICTWNRAALLDKTLECMRGLRIPAGVEWHLLVVDNNSTDDTDAVLDRHAARLPIRKLFESKQGQSHARNAAIAAASGDLIVWTDDDVLVSENWLAAYARAAAEHPAASYFGGPVQPWYEREPPRWFARNLAHFGKVVALVDRGDADRRLNDGEFVIGANMAFRLADMKHYPFNALLSRTGAKLAGCEDHDVIFRMQADGKHGRWIVDAKVRHFIPAERMTLCFARQWWSEQAQLHHRKEPYGGLSPHGAPRWLWRQYAEASARELFHGFRRGPKWAAAFFEAAWLRGLIDLCTPELATPPSDAPPPAAAPRPAAEAPAAGAAG
jgi:glycosyltransferase involved in cell wall biosynthesis